MLSTSLIVIWFTLPAIMWIAKHCIRKRIHPALLCILCVLTVIAGYVVLLNSVWAIDAHLEAEMNKYDLDGDGGIGGEEWTPEAQRATDEWASDTGRSMAIFFGAPLTAIWYTVVFAFLFGGEFIFRRIFMSKAALENSPENDVAAVEKRDDDGNPYRPPIVG